MSELITNDESAPTRKPGRYVVKRQVSPPPPPPSSGPGGMSIVAILLLVIVLASIIGSCYLLYHFTGTIADMPGRTLRGIRDALEADEPTMVVVRPPVIEQLRPLSRLQTQEYFLQTVVEVSKPRWIGGIATEKLLLVACGRVTAGIDLSKLTDDDVRTVGSKVIIHLPQAEVFDTILDEDEGCTYVYDHDVPIFSSGNEELADEARREARASFEQTALENGILERAQLRAQEEVARLLLLAGYEQVEFTEAGEEILSPGE